ncbi:MAG: biotin/lipoyl-binding protein [Clostridia bacterium]|nr:biotin/lipoyl-binding protein [Clostridia bacterium]
MIYKVTLNNKIYEVEVEEGKAMLLDEYEAMAPAAPAPAAAPAAAAAPAVVQSGPSASVVAGNQIKAPLPGTVLSVKVSMGQQVKSGDVLMVVEAMKMENDIVAPADGTVKQILKDKGAVVATGDVLMVI